MLNIIESKLDEWKKELIDAVSPDDIIASIFRYIDAEEFSSNTESIHQQIYRLSKMPEYEDLLKDFTFIDSYPFSYSPLLERVIMRLQISKFLVSQNPDYVLYQIKQDARESIDRGSVSKFSDTDKEKLKKMGKELGRALKEESTQEA